MHALSTKVQWEFFGLEIAIRKGRIAIKNYELRSDLFKINLIKLDKSKKSDKSNIFFNLSPSMHGKFAGTESYG